MARTVFGYLVIFLLTISPVSAGFEWVPPAENPEPRPATPSSPHGGFPAPVVSAAVPVVPMVPNQRIVPPPVPTQTRNLSGKKLFIDPYPLRNNVARPNKMSLVDTYKAMSEGSDTLHPVKLGSGMSTGVKDNTKPIVPTRLGSAHGAISKHKKHGGDMTPMLGGEPAALPNPRDPQPVERIASHQNYANAVGFGRELPMALALSQVIPSEFTHSFAKDIDTGVTVSWEGGKPWDQVLNDMLRPKNLTAVIQNKQVIIQPMA